MLGKSFSLLFFLKRPKNYAGGKMPVYLRITIDGNAREWCTPENAILKSGTRQQELL